MTPEKHREIERLIDNAVTEVLDKHLTNRTPVHIAVVVDSIATDGNGTTGRSLAVYDPDRPPWEIAGLLECAADLFGRCRP